MALEAPEMGERAFENDEDGEDGRACGGGRRQYCDGEVTVVVLVLLS